MRHRSREETKSEPYAQPYVQPGLRKSAEPVNFTLEREASARMFELLKDFSLKALGLVMPFVVRWLYKPAKLANGIKVRVRGEGDGVTYNCGELPNIRIWLLVTNLTPFEIEIDRIYGQLAYGCVIGEIFHLRRHVLPPAQEEEILIEVSLNEHQVQHIRRNVGKLETKLYFGAYVISKIHSLELAREIGTNNVRHLNCAL